MRFLKAREPLVAYCAEIYFAPRNLRPVGTNESGYFFGQTCRGRCITDIIRQMPLSYTISLPHVHAYTSSLALLRLFCHIFSRRPFITLSLTATSFLSLTRSQLPLFTTGKYRSEKDNSDVSLFGPAGRHVRNVSRTTSVAERK